MVAPAQDGLFTGPIASVLSVSGGKDSTAMYLLALEREVPFTAVFADVGNEHPATLEYVARLAERTGGPKVVTVRADLSDKFERKRETIAAKWPAEGIAEDVVARALELCRPTGNPFLDACLLMSGFPSHQRRFCTDKLKLRPISDNVTGPLLRSGHHVASWQGVRREESFAREHLARLEAIQIPRRLGAKPGVCLVAYRPLLDWALADVWKMHRRHGIEPNPLYAQGANRVGCFPCVMTNKLELRMIAEQFPEHIDRISEWERIVSLASKREGEGGATFFTNARGANIREAADWSRTARGGREYDLIPLAEQRNDLLEACTEWGACE